MKLLLTISFIFCSLFSFSQEKVELYIPDSTTNVKDFVVIKTRKDVHRVFGSNFVESIDTTWKYFCWSDTKKPIRVYYRDSFPNFTVFYSDKSTLKRDFIRTIVIDSLSSFSVQGIHYGVDRSLVDSILGNPRCLDDGWWDYIICDYFIQNERKIIKISCYFSRVTNTLISFIIRDFDDRLLLLQKK
ncbi:MAG: hypothetical protein ACLGGV_02225 [Bacteroidia bacterium]